MKHKIFLSITILLMVALSACSNQASKIEATSIDAVEETYQAEVTSSVETSTSPSEAVATIVAGNSETHEDTKDYEWDSSTVIPITLNGDSISSDSPDISIDENYAVIISAGTYSLSGTLTNGQIVVDTQDEETVRIILNNAEISSASSAPIYVKNAEKVVIILADGTENILTDASSYVHENADEDEPNAALFSKSDLTIYGSGSLIVTGNYNDGISSKDGLIIASGSITVNAVDDGIRGKDYVVIKDGILNITAQGDGVKSDNEEDPAKGFITIYGGNLTLSSGGDAISAQTDVIISGGEFSLTAANGSGNPIDETTSAKGIKGLASVSIDSGTFFIDTADDSIHSNGDITINGGTYEIYSGDDGIHSDTSLTINNGEIGILESYEGIESALITINGGNTRLTASDDGINVAGGADSSGFGMIGGQPMPGRIPGQDSFASMENYYLYINGGYVFIDADGDGIDSNGNIEMTNGTVIVNGPTENMNGALDYIGGFTMTGGEMIAAGSAGMAMAPDQSSSVNSVLIAFTETIPAGTLVNIQSNAGDEVLTFTSSKEFQSLLVSSPKLLSGTTYQIYTGGNASGTMIDGIYEGEGYTPGSQYDAFTVTSTVTYIGISGATGGGFPGGGGGGGKPRR